MKRNNSDVLEDVTERLNKGGKVLISTMDSPFLDSDRVFPYLGVLYLLSMAKSLGLKVKYIQKPGNAVRDLQSFDVFYTNSVEFRDIYSYNCFDVIALSVLTPQGQQAKRLLQKIKSLDKNKIVIIGGSHATYYSDECIAAGYDIIVQGEGERIFRYLLEGDIEAVRRYVRNDTMDSSMVLVDRLPKEVMNSFPLPLREKDYIGGYKYELEGRWATTMVNSRGCPMGCKFCEHSKTGGRWYSPDHFEKELISIMDIRLNAIMIFDDLFAISSKALRPYAEILKKYHKSRKLVYRCFGHARSVANDPELAAMLSESGCVEVGFGAESGCQKILDTIAKRTTVEMAKDFIEQCISKNIKVKAFFMVGLPGETHDTIRETYEFIKYYRMKYPSMFDFDAAVFFPYKGTLIGDAMRLKDGEAIHNGREIITNKTFNLRLIPGLSWEDVDNGSYGAYKKKGGDSDMLTETYDHSRNKVLLKAEEMGEYKEKIMHFSRRYTNSDGRRIFSPVKESNI